MNQGTPFANAVYFSMKLLWVKTDFLHPTTRGGQIRTLETLRRLHQWHEVHYVAFDDPAQPEGLARSFEYCAKAYPVAHRVPDKTSARFALQLVEGLFSRMPVAVSRYRSAAMRRKLEELLRREKFDSRGLRLSVSLAEFLPPRFLRSVPTQCRIHDMEAICGT